VGLRQAAHTYRAYARSPFRRIRNFTHKTNPSSLLRLGPLCRTHSTLPLAALEHLKMPRLGRKQLLRLSDQTSSVLLLDFRLRDEVGFLRFDNAGASLGKVAGSGSVLVGSLCWRGAPGRAHFLAVGFADFLTAP
jgi:hypothetical protein